MLLGCLVLVGAGIGIGIAVGRATVSNHASARTGHSAPSVTSPTEPPDPSTPTKNGAAGNFAGDWSAHSLSMAIDTAGHGILTYRLYSTCDAGSTPCDVMLPNEIWDGGFVTFRLRATGSTTASGEVLTSAAPGDVPLGPFTARFDSGNDLIYFSFQDAGSSPVCGPQARSGACGA